MAKDKLLMREGFWQREGDSILPKPIPNEKRWKGKREFLRALVAVQDKAALHKYRGLIKCQLCQHIVGYEEYEHQGWIWPSTFSHYVSEHNVRPSLAFHEFVLGKELG